MNPTTQSASFLEAFVAQMTSRMATLTRNLGTQMQQTPHTLAEVETALLPQVRELAAALLAGLATLAAPSRPEPLLPCSCGKQASYQRIRTAKVATIFGPISLPRAYYSCSACQHGFAPLDAQLQFVAGSRSDGLDELLALLGATQDSFAEASQVLERLTLVRVCANSVRDATESLGAVLVAETAARAECDQTIPVLADQVNQPSQPLERLYISMDGIQTHLRGSGWNEMKVGCVYQTNSSPDRVRPERLNIRMEQPSYTASLEEASSFGKQIWSEALRRGVLQAREIVVVGDGSAWIWNIAERQFAGATQILDWYHASSYIWEAANTIWSSETAERSAWVKKQLDRLWEGQIEELLSELERKKERGEAVRNALIYYTNQRSRMDYPSYRARGMQIGSGSIESACKQLVTTRLKLAGMIWDASGAEQVVAVRAWLKSGRWAEAMARRPRRQRTYTRAQAPKVEACPAESQTTQSIVTAAPECSSSPLPTRRSALPAEVRERIQAELAAERANHRWRKPWSRRQQQAQQTERASTQALASSP